MVGRERGREGGRSGRSGREREREKEGEHLFHHNLLDSVKKTLIRS